jgi:hypothetical protein
MSLLGSILKGLAVVAAVAVAFVPGVGNIVDGVIASALWGAGATSIVAGTIATIETGIGLIGLSAGLSLAQSAFGKVPATTLSRLNLTTDPNAPRKIVFGGGTAMASDTEYTA